MKKILFVVVIMIGVTSVALAQSTIAANAKKDNLTKETLINLEKRMWQSRIDKDDKHLYILTTEDVVSVGEFGVANKSAILKSVTRAPCQIKSYKMGDVSVTILNANTALLTYKAEQERVCEGVVGLASAWASSIYLKQNAKWLNAFRQETTVSLQK